MERNALIIFARKPVLGKVKTRLAATIGEEAALAVYVRLLQHTRDVAAELECDTHVFLTEAPSDAFWDGFRLKLQAAGDLGEKMQDAFAQLFMEGYRNVVIIGSDCPGLQAATVRQAFAGLAARDTVIGPAADGGYYLLGMKRMHERLFRNKRWSGPAVFADTLRDIGDLGLTAHLLPVLSDLDEAGDLPEGWL